MRNFKKVYFGCSDAYTEAKRMPEDFDKSFFDSKDNIKELIYGSKFIICGRKGDGKSAYSAKINLMKDTTEVKSYQRSLDNFNNCTFEKIMSYDKLGGNPYIAFWKCIIMIECVKMLHIYQPHNQDNNYITIFDALQRYGFLETDNDISITIDKLVESNTTLNIRDFFGHNRHREYDNKLQGAGSIYDVIVKSIKNLYFDKERYLLIIDGLDDILNNTEFNPKIITGLLRACDIINNTFENATLKLKILVIIRDDVFNICRDPNLNKLARDSMIKLTWSISEPYSSSDLVKLVKKRFDIAWNEDVDFMKIWEEFFPKNINGKYSFEYMLDNIIYRPRDILQFFIEAQNAFEEDTKFTEDAFQTILHNYSSEYFLCAMQDELTGFFPDKAVTKLPEVLTKLGVKEFHVTDFETECNKYPDFYGVNPTSLLEKLFVNGYIGQHRPRVSKEFTVFKYRNPRENFQEEHECLLHRGLMRALSL